MKKRGTHEGCIEQMERLFAERLYTADGKVPVDEENRIRMDDWELDPEVQAEVDKIMPNVTEENVNELVDLKGIRHDFLAINGFDVAGIDYEKDVTDMTKID
jgi:enoyl-[acyl-carrier protein] reductase/trans-2-enoyl-CoA reductase (NAD+)